MAWQEFSANVPRYQGAAQRLLIEGERTNLNPNPRAEGSVAGTSGTLPTGWTATDTAVSRQIIGQTTRNGVSGLLVRYFGTPTGTGAQTLVCGPADVVVAGTVVSNSVFVELVAGTLTNVSVFTLRSAAEAGGTNFTPGLLARQTNVRTLAATGSSTALRWNYNDTVTPVEFTLFIGWPQREHAAFASSPILPAIGTPAASTRGADLASATLASLGVPANGACTILGTAMIPQQAPATASQIILHIDDGSDANRIMVRNSPGSANIVLTRTTATTPSDSTAQTITIGTLFRFGLTIDGAGNALLSVDGVSPLSVAGAPTSGLTTLRIGSNSGGTGNAFSEIGSLRVLQGVVSGAELQALVNTL